MMNKCSKRAKVIHNGYNFLYSKRTESIKNFQHDLDLRNANSRTVNCLFQYQMNADKCSEWWIIFDNDYNLLYNRYTGYIKKNSA